MEFGINEQMNISDMAEIKIAIVVVLYGELPLQYVYNVHDCPVILVDNTPERDLKISQSGIKYIALKKNWGIAHALNVGFQEAKYIGANWVLTMDQDSELPSEMIGRYKHVVTTRPERLGLLCPEMNIYKGQGNKSNATIKKVDYALTSGSLVNMVAYDKTGGFREELFIDSVDFEFCLNLRSHGYVIYKVGDVLMQHQLGNTREYKLLGFHLFYVTNHNYIRHYYVARNSLYLKELYPQYIKRKTIRPFWLSKLKILLFEEDAARKLKAIKKGIEDYKKHKFGEFSGDV